MEELKPEYRLITTISTCIIIAHPGYAHATDLKVRPELAGGTAVPSGASRKITGRSCDLPAK